ncbi:MAG TPA: PRC-barrel domain-containing protein [Croceibacterium sp.]|nr:PRC-barrel domain-containing protein [Croceibacterium sp.]
MTRLPAAAACAAALLAGCNNNPATEATGAAATEAAATTAPPTPAETPATAALGLTDAQLLDASLYATDGTKLGEVEGLLRASDGRVDRLLIEIEGSDPDRFVEIPARGMAVLKRGDDADLVATTTAAELASLPDAKAPAK